MGRLGIDFGTSNTVLAVWDEARKEGRPLALGELSRLMPSGSDNIPVVPSIIHFGEAQRTWVGQQVHAQRLYESNQTFRGMKSAIRNRNNAIRKLRGREITAADAGRDFLAAVLGFGAAELGLGDEEVAFTVPVEAFEHYTDWLGTVATGAGITRYRFLDEPSAAALGYGAHVQPGNVYVMFDFGGGTLDVALVLIEDAESATIGRRCRVLGKAGLDLGGLTIDQWLYQEVLRQAGRHESDEDVRAVSRELLVRCEAAKEALSSQPAADISTVNPETGAHIGISLSREAFEKVLGTRDLPNQINRVIRRALNDAVQKGFTEDNVHSVLMLGGSSLIPLVQQTVRGFFGNEKVKLDRPLDAVARGASAFVAGVDFYDFIQHDYAIRHVNPKKGDYDYRVLVKRGTAYPTKEPLARLTVKATYHDQKQLGVAIFEVADAHGAPAGQAVELVFDPSGAARVRDVSADERERRGRFWLNEHSPTFLGADPPAKKGEERFTVEFAIDGNKHLLITARDSVTGKLQFKEYPVVKLT